MQLLFILHEAEEASFFSEFLFSIITGVIGSFIFIFLLLYLLRPSVKISPNICYLKIKPDDQYYYLFKIVNTSFFSTYDVNIKLVKKEPYMVNRGSKINHRLINIEISSVYKNHLPGIDYSKGVGEHAYLIRTSEDLKESIVDKKITVRMTVSSKHGLTNLHRTVTQDFLTPDVIKVDKEFVFGKSLDTV